MADPVLRADAVVKRFGGVTALDGVSLDVRAGECVALVGESGSGKSTLLRAFLALTAIDGGRVTVGGDDVAAADPVRLRRGIGYVPQDGGLLPHWTVARNAALVPWLAGAATPEAAASDALNLVGMPVATFGARWPRELSGGQRQRVAFARALAARPSVLLLDEPSGALDAITRSDLQAMFATLRRQTGVTTLLVTHDLHEARRLADRVAVLCAGRLEQIATAETLVSAPATPYVASLIARAGLAGAPA
jgi:osmoprotectant transport system ATP-binding protein